MVSAAIAAALSAAFSLPRILFWENRPFSAWYPEAIIFSCGFVLWAFVFAWHTKYSGRPVFTLKISPASFTLASLTGMVAAVSVQWLMDPTLRARTPEDYPASTQEWIAKTLFDLAFWQLFLTFAPFAWLMRLFRNQSIAIALTVLLGLVVLILKIRSSPIPVPTTLFVALVVFRIAGGLLAIAFYLRGGVVLVSWWTFLVQLRLLFGIQH